jgi:hypothetical protein
MTYVVARLLQKKILPKCSFGQKEFDISNMGETGLTVLKIY